MMALWIVHLGRLLKRLGPWYYPGEEDSHADEYKLEAPASGSRR